MRVCIVSPDPIADGGGIELSQRRIAGLLADAGHEVHLVRLSEDSTPQEWGAKRRTVSELESWHSGVRVFDVTPWFALPETEYAWQEVYKGFEGLCQMHHYDLFHAFSLNRSGFVTVSLARRFGKPAIASGQGSDINRKVFSEEFFSKIVWTLQHADWLTFVSTAMQRAASAIVDCTEQSSVILNATGTELFDPPEAPGPAEADASARRPTTFGGAGVLSDKKGQDVLTLALKELLARNNHVRLHWIGSCDLAKPLRFAEDLRSMVEAGHARFTGMVPHRTVLNRLRELGIYVLASPDEGCPNALLEAMLARRPVVATSVGAVPEILRDRVDGLLVPPFDVGAIVDAVEELLGSPDVARALAESAYARVLGRFSLRQEREAWLACYHRVLGAAS